MILSVDFLTFIGTRVKNRKHIMKKKLFYRNKKIEKNKKIDHESLNNKCLRNIMYLFDKKIINYKCFKNFQKYFNDFFIFENFLY